MKKSIAFSVTLASCSLLTFSMVAAAAGPVRDGNAPRPGAKEVHVAGASNISGWAVVEADGTLTRKDNATAVIKIGTGNYEVDFNSKLTHCAYSALIATSSAGNPSTGYIEASPRSGNIKGVFIETHDTALALSDRPFHLIVTCS